MIPFSYQNSVFTNFQLLPEQVQVQVADYVQFLVFKYNSFAHRPPKKEAIDDLSLRQFGKYKGSIKVPLDFNEEIDDFNEY